MRRIHLLSVCLALTLLALGCSSTTKPATTTTTPPGNSSGLQVTSPTTSPIIDVGQAVTIMANEAVIWSLQDAVGFGKVSGALSNTTSPSTSVTYTAPISISGPSGPSGQAQVSVVGTSTTDSTQSASIIVFVNPPLALNSNLTINTDCSYDPAIGNNDGSVGTTYVSSNGFNNYLRVSGGTAPYTWSVSSGSLPFGLSLGSFPVGSTSCSSGCAYLYGTPSSVGCSQFQVLVTDATGANATTTLPTFVVVTPPPLKVQATDYVDWVQGVPYPPVSFTVSGGVPPYSWTPDPNIPLPQSLTLIAVTNNTSTAYISGTPTAPPNGTPDLIVTDSETPYPATDVVNTATSSGGFKLNQNLDIPQVPCTPYQGPSGPPLPTYNSTMLGTYAFLLRGFDSNGPAVMAGSFTADGDPSGAPTGNVTGVVDITRSTSADSQSDVAVSGSYTVFGGGGNAGVNFGQIGCVTLKGGSGASAFTNTFAISLGGCSTSLDPIRGNCTANSQGVSGVFTTGRMIEFDSTGTLVTGILRMQDTSAFSGGPTGPYAFGLTGFDSAGKRYAAAGSMNASSGAFASGAADINDGGVLQSALTGGTGSYAIDSTNGPTTGRGTASLTVGSASLDLVFYVVSTHEVMLASTGTLSPANPILSGEAITAAGPFGTGSMQNSHMFHTAGLAPSGPDVSIGILSFDGVGDVTGTQYEDQAGTLGTTPLSGTYIVNSSTGRVSFLPSQTNPQSLGDHPLVIYPIPVPSTLTRLDCVNLASCVTGFMVSTDESAQGGVLEFQTPTNGPPPPFSALYVQGYYFYGTDESIDMVTPLLNGASNASPNGPVYSGVQSSNYSSSSFYCVQEQLNYPQQPPCVLLHPNELISGGGTYSVSSNGTATIGGETVAVTNGNVIFYIDESPINSSPSVIVEEQ